MTGEGSTLNHRFQRGLPLFLLALTMLLTAWGGSFLRSQEASWEKITREEQAREILDGIAARPRFSQFLERFDQFLMHDLALAEQRRHDLFTETGRQEPLPIQSILGHHVRSPFPEHEFWFFTFSDGVPRLLLAPLDTPHGRRVPTLAFETLVDRHLGRKRTEQELTAGGRKVESLFGTFSAPDLLAREQRGRATLVIYRRMQYWLVWNVLQARGQPQYGYFLLVPKRNTLERTGLALGLREFSRDGGLAGFVSIFKPGKLDVLSPGLARSARFRTWLRGWSHASRRKTLELHGGPWGVPIGKHLLYSRVIPHAKHLAVLLLPASSTGAFPPLVFFGLGFGLFLVLRLLGEGLLLDRWSHISLRWRFFLLVAIAAGIPLGLAWWAGRAYIFERRQTLFQDLRRHLGAELDHADQGKELLQGNYLEAFQRTIRHPPLLDALRREGMSNPRLFDMLTEWFHQASPTLPLSYVGLYDVEGKSFCRIGSGVGALDLGDVMPFYKVNFARCLAERQRKQNPGGVVPQARFTSSDLAINAVYETASSNDSKELMEQRRGQVEYIQFGRRMISKIFDFVRIDGIDRYVLFLAWTTEALESLTLESSRTSFMIRNPQIRFTAFRNENLELQPVYALQSDHLADFLPTAREALVRERAQYRYESSREVLFLARPSQSLSQIILAVAASTTPLETELRFLRWGLNLLTGFSLFGIVLLGGLGGRRMVEPLLKVQQGVEEVTRGHLDGNLALDRHDELGHLSRAFDSMVEGLRTRARLSTLVSGQVLPSLTTVNGPGTAGESGRRFRGVVLVSDLRDFTTLCEQRPVQEITDLLNRHFERMTVIITRYGGRIDKFIGDAIQAVFTNDPSAGETAAAAERAVIAAQDMVREMANINRERTEAGHFPYRLGIGLATSELIMGPVGDPATRFDLVLMGHGVERSAQLEALSKQVPWYPIVLDRETAELAGPISGSLTPGPSHEDGPTFIFPRPDSP